MLSRVWFEFSFNNPKKVKPIHTAIYFWSIELCNKLGWKDQFSLPSEIAMEAIGVKSYSTYIKALKDLVDWDFILMIQKSKNQHTANIIALAKIDKAHGNALDKAIKMHESELHQSNYTIDKPKTFKLINKELQVENLTDEVIHLSGIISAFFNITKVHHGNSYLRIADFVQTMDSKGKLNLLRKQFQAYQKVKVEGFKHSLKNYVGTSENSYEDGAWNEKDWTKEIILNTYLTPPIGYILPIKPENRNPL